MTIDSVLDSIIEWVRDHRPHSRAGWAKLAGGVGLALVAVAYIVAGIATAIGEPETSCITWDYARDRPTPDGQRICTTTEPINWIATLTVGLGGVAYGLVLIAVPVGIIWLIVRTARRARATARDVHRDGAAWQSPAPPYDAPHQPPAVQRFDQTAPTPQLPDTTPDHNPWA